MQPGTSFSWKSGPGTIRSTFEVVQRPTELSWSGLLARLKAEAERRTLR